jgi:AcrR family transcriptional regulator
MTATRDPDAKREMILQGALAEFAEFGLGGARLSSLAKRAGVSAGLVYAFHESKEALFDAVYDAIVGRVVSDISMDTDDLPGYAGLLFDGLVENPEIARFLGWYRLQGGPVGGGEVANAATAEKVEQIRLAQAAGKLPSSHDPAQILAVTVGAANMWQVMGDDMLQLVDVASRRATTVETVRRFLS